MSNTVIIIKLGYQEWAIRGKAGAAGKLLELLSGAVKVDRRYEKCRDGQYADAYYIEPTREGVEVKVVPAARGESSANSAQGSSWIAARAPPSA